MKFMNTRICMALAFVIALAAGPRAYADANQPAIPVEANLLVNPGFEDDVAYNGWFTFGAGVQLSTPAGDNIMHTGTAASKIYGEFTNCPGLPQFDVGGFGQAFIPQVGMIYHLSGYCFVASGDPMPGTDTCVSNRVLAKIVFFDAASGGNEIGSNEVIIADHTTALDQWNEFRVQAPAPAGALRVEALFLFLQPGCDNGTAYIDDVNFEALMPASTAGNVLLNPSFSGNLNSWTVFGNVYYDGRSWARRTPLGSAKLFSTFTPASDSGMYQEFAATPASEWQLDAYAMTTCVESPLTGANQNVLVATISFRDAMGVEIGTSSQTILDNTAPLGTWTKHTVTGTAPAGTAFARAYILFVSPALEGGAAWVDDLYFGPLLPTGVGDRPVSLGFTLHQNVPNPFSPETRIDFDLDNSDDVSVTVYDVRGRRVTTLTQGRLGSGPHSVTWDGRLAGGRTAPSGVYWCVLQTSTGKASRRMVLLR